jgi:hypothetical protein
MRHLRDTDCRCRDDGCPEREKCLRWIERNTRGYATKKVDHSPSLRSYNKPLGDPCNLRIPMEEKS